MCAKGAKLFGYLHFKTSHLPFPCLKFEEILVDVEQEPDKTAGALVEAIKGFRERYGYRRIFAYAPETSDAITSALASQGFRKNGAMKDYYFIDGHYVNVAVFSYP